MHAELMALEDLAKSLFGKAKANKIFNETSNLDNDVVSDDVEEGFPEDFLVKINRKISLKEAIMFCKCMLLWLNLRHLLK
ncbi:MAG TPA: hypothetical protein VNW06_05145 [Cytophagaceae bacterium]|jgi:hypothetical protein|nr:hypothetical protein [Cytophagaceae bacterium]